MHGCDTTSASFNKVKLKFLKGLQRKNELQPITDAFKDPHTIPGGDCRSRKRVSHGSVWDMGLA